MANILIIDSDLGQCQLLTKFLNRKGHNSFYALEGKKAFVLLKEEHPVDIVFCDFRLPDACGKEMLLSMKELHPSLQVVITTNYSDVKVAVDVIKNGAFDYIIKPLLPEEILLLIDKILALRINQHISLVKKNEVKKEKQEQFNSRKNFTILDPEKVVVQSNVTRGVYYQARLVAPTDYSVLLFGESGTGKGWLARGIHELSKRCGEPFISVDCGCISNEWVEAELFGTEQTFSIDGEPLKLGYFEKASGGTIFLAEIGSLPLHIQTNLLRVVKEKKIRRAGSFKEIDIDVRIIASSSERLSELVAHEKFNEELYHCLNEFSIDVPSLRERKEDIMPLARAILNEVNVDLNKNILNFVPEVERIFKEYMWPGNLREMNNIIKRAALLTSTDSIGLETLPQEIIFQSKFSLKEDHKEHTTILPVINNLKSAAIYAEYEKILEVLRQVKFNKSKAALILNIDRKTLYNKMKTFNVLFSEQHD